MNVRTVDKNDLEEWVEMRSELWPRSAQDHAHELGEYFVGDSIDIIEAFVVESEAGELAGFIELNVRNFAEGSRSPRVPYVEAWFVRSECRGNGFGYALMEKAEQWALGKGFSELASDTELENTNSIALHKHLGYIETERVVCFLKKLG